MKQFRTLFGKELHHLFNSPIVYIFTALFLALNNFFFFNNFFLAGQATMRPFFTSLPIILIFFVPTLVMGSFSGEKKSGTLELLLSLPIRNLEAVLAKFAAALAFFTFVLFSTLPTLAIITYFGKPDFGPILTAYFGTLLLICLYLGVGILLSVLTKEQIISFLLSSVFLFSLYLSGEEVVLEKVPYFLQIVLTIVSPSPHFLNFVKGVIYPKDLIYFFTLTIFFLWLAGKKVGFEKEKFKFDRLGILIISLLLLNIISYFSLPIKVDLTERKAFTVSQATKDVVGQLDDIINIKVFASTNLPPRFLLLRQNLKDLLEEYRWLAKGKLQVLWSAPDKNSQASDLAQRLGIPQLQFSSVEEDKFQVTQGFLGLAVLFEDQKEVIPIIETDANLEYQLTSSLLKVSEKKRPVVGLVAGHGEIWEKSEVFLTGQRLVEKVLGKEFIVEDFNLASGSALSVPDNFNVLVIAGPKNYFDEKNQFVLDQFLMTGKPILFFLDGVEVSNTLQAVPAKHNLFTLLKSYGLFLKKDLVFDESSAIANFNAGLTTFFVPYPAWVKVLPEGIAQENPATFGLQGLVLPWVSSIEFSQQDSRVTPLVYSSPKSWTVKEAFNLDPTQDWQPEEQKEQLLAVLLSGKLESAFDKKIAKDFQFEKDFIGQTDQGKLLLVGDSESLEENIATSFTPNWHFLLNLLEFLTSGQNLAQIQVKMQDIRPLKEVEIQQKEAIKYSNIIGIPLFVGLLGGGYLYWRERQKFTSF